MSYCTTDQIHSWREEVMYHLEDHYEFEDPGDRDYTQQPDKDPYEIVEEDKECIQRSHVLLAHAWKPSPGTSMEILYAHSRGMYVVVVTPADSPWYTAHANFVCSELNEAIHHLMTKVMKR